jgi:hypothetical protein
MKRFLLWCAAFCGICASCVIPSGLSLLNNLAADPVRHLVRQYDAFFPTGDLTVTAYYDDGEAFELSYVDYAVGYNPPDTTTLGEQTGSVTYRGRTAYFQIYVYDDTNPPANSGPLIIVPVR